MPRCLFCEKDFPKLSNEHVFPAALGGNLELRDGVCEKCNNDFSKFESPLAKELVPIRLLLKIPDRDGEIPEADAIAKTISNEYVAKAQPDGKVRLRPIVSVVKGGDGSKEIHFQFATDAQLEKLRRDAEAGKIQLLESETSPSEEAEVEVSGDLRVIGSIDGLRTAAKIAFIGLAFCGGSVFAASEAFAAVRDFIRFGKGTSSSRLFIHEKFLSSVEMGPHQHAIILAGRNDRHRVDAIVRLFGGLSYFVVLSDRYEGADFLHTLVCDAQRGELNGMLFSVVEAELLQTEDVYNSEETIWDDLPASGTWFINFLDGRIKRLLA